MREVRLSAAGSLMASGVFFDGSRFLVGQTAVQALLLASQRAQVLHEGFIEAARLLEATFYR